MSKEPLFFSAACAADEHLAKIPLRPAVITKLFSLFSPPLLSLTPGLCFLFFFLILIASEDCQTFWLRNWREKTLMTCAGLFH